MKKDKETGFEIPSTIDDEWYEYSINQPSFIDLPIWIVHKFDTLEHVMCIGYIPTVNTHLVTHWKPAKLKIPQKPHLQISYLDDCDRDWHELNPDYIPDEKAPDLFRKERIQ